MRAVLTAAASALLLLGGLAHLPSAAGIHETHAAAQTYPGDIPAQFNPPTANEDYTERVVMIPMRDGVRLKTIILIPKGAARAPLLLTRTPYNAAARLARNASPHLESVLREGADTTAASGYIRVFQDIRGKFGSGGKFVMTRPVRGPLNPTEVDESTDAYDTIDWLVRHVPESNGRVGIIGTSYNGYTALMAALHPHPALKVVVAINPMVDGWIGDDWFHNGAFRTVGMQYIYKEESSRSSDFDWPSGFRDDYTAFLEAGSMGYFGRKMGMEQLGFWRRITQHPAYDRFWQDQAVDRILARQPLTVPLLLVHSLWDEEDIYGAIAVFGALGRDAGGGLAHLVIGPWRHGGASASGSALGPIQFGSDTALHFRKKILQPFLDQYLKKGSPPAHLYPVLAFETGTNVWRRYRRWPRSCAAGCPYRSKALYLLSGGKLDFRPPSGRNGSFDQYVSDPAKPVPYRIRPDLSLVAPDSSWDEWLVDDQRNFSDRPDVLTYVSDPLGAPVRVSGQPVVHLFASTSGTDTDWVVKLIDVYPDEYPPEPVLGGYQLMISADILRGRYRSGFARSRSIQPGKVLLYTLRLPHVNHVFEPGHRIMVQIQSSWFPLYDRNPQTYVANIFFADPDDYKQAVQRIYRRPGDSSSIELPVTPGPSTFERDEARKR
jgi:putative CocE/NonD family hydrolase